MPLSIPSSLGALWSAAYSAMGGVSTSSQPPQQPPTGATLLPVAPDLSNDATQLEHGSVGSAAQALSPPARRERTEDYVPRAPHHLDGSHSPSRVGSDEHALHAAEMLRDMQQRNGRNGAVPHRSGPPSASTLQSDDWGVSDVRQYTTNHPSAVRAAEGRAQGSPTRTSTSHLRTVEQAYNRVGGPPPLPSDFPVGPFASLSMHIDRLHVYASNPSLGGGIFQLRERNSKGASIRRGQTARVVCNREGHHRSHAGVSAADPADAMSTSGDGRARDGRRNRGSFRCGCLWSVSLEVVAGADGHEQCATRHFPCLSASPQPCVPVLCISYMSPCRSSYLPALHRSIVVAANLEHNHTLPFDLPSSLPFQTHRPIPPELEAVAADLQGFRLPFEIHTMLVRMAKRRNMEVSWTERDIQNRYPHGGNGTMWQTEELLERLSVDGRAYRKSLRSDDSGVLSTLIWMQHNGDMEVVLSAADCVIFDNTFNTNSLGYKLGVFSTVDRLGCTRLVACSLMLNETREAFAIILGHFAELLGSTPVVILTDGDLWLGEAVSLQWGSMHFLCTWHLSKNILRKVKPCFATSSGPLGQSSPWSVFLRKWWCICWKSDTSTCDYFDEEWLELRQYFCEHVSHPDSTASQSALAFLGGPGGDDDEDEAMSSEPQPAEEPSSSAREEAGTDAAIPGECIPRHFTALAYRIMPYPSHIMLHHAESCHILQCPAASLPHCVTVLPRPSHLRRRCDT